MARRIIVVGGGPAGVFAALEAKRTDPSAELVLLSEESCEPYEKPALSKAVLCGKALPQDAPTAGHGGVAAHGVLLACNERCVAIDRDARAVLTASGRRYAYDALVLATGSVVRELPEWPVGSPFVHYLRTQSDALALKAALLPGRHLVLIGGGLIGLEVAASATTLGVRSTVLERAPRILARVCDEATAAAIADAHRRHGVEILTGAVISHAEATTIGVDITTGDGQVRRADVVAVGAGVTPNVALAAEAGLAVDDGVIVDAFCRTSDPAIYAAGDVARFPGPDGPVRLENWRHAQDHGMVAGRNAAGGSQAYREQPSFWSEQYDLYVQGVGWTAHRADRTVHRPVAGRCPLVFRMTGDTIVSAMGVNMQRDIAAASRLIERRVQVDAAALADPSRPLAAMLRQNA
ncbi:MAG TPA: FAD-dependent oxidoreductase [Caulobacteraceae bacterium]|nr:FAD-dependent oxidoreductase [Caulobacteraceae bacterium]